MYLRPFSSIYMSCVSIRCFGYSTWFTHIDVSRMWGYEDISTTQVYAKILKITINQYSTKLQNSIKEGC